MERDYEQAGMRLSVAGSALLALSAIIMALAAKSQAILLDGLYTLVTLAMALVSLRVIRLLKTPESRTRPFGFMALEPFFNFIKSLGMLILLTVFLVTNIQELSTGGRWISLDMTIVYIFLCLFIYAGIILMLKHCGRRARSSILALEIQNWQIDAMQTAGIAVSLVIAMILLKLGYTAILPYIDPLIVIALVVISLPMPAKVVVKEFRRLLLVAPENSIEQEVKTQIAEVAERYGITETQVWGLNSGRTLYLFLYCNLKEDHVTITGLDEIRVALLRKLALLYPAFWADIQFTRINPELPFQHIVERAGP
ncbi:MAG: cation transporter [Kiritimatiellae bacterium]|nr:cation transporter [Kiritimatiellia bacterium]